MNKFPSTVQLDCETTPRKRVHSGASRAEADPLLIHFSPTIPLPAKNGARRWEHAGIAYREVSLEAITYDPYEDSRDFRQMDAMVRAKPNRAIE